MGEPAHVIVTGATGLIGRALVERLTADGNAVTALVRPGSDAAGLPAAVRRHQLDLSAPFDADDIPSDPIDAVVHLAQHRSYASFPKGAGSVASVTIAAACRLAELATDRGASHLVFASSGGIYASSASPVREDATIRPPDRLGFYLTAKAVGEQLLGAFRPHLAVTCLRFFFVYGPGQAAHFLIPRLVASVRDGTPIEVASGRGPRINPVHVSDAAAATAACLRPGAPEVLNVAGPTVATVREIATIIGERVGREPRFTDVDEDPADLVAELDRMRGVHEPLMRLEEGLAEVCG